MAKTIGDLKKTIAAFTRRSQASYQGENGDSLMVAINHAKDFAQRGVDFERAFEEVQVTVADVNVGGNLKDAKRVRDLNLGVTVKTLRKAFLQTQTTEVFVPVEMISRQAYVDSLQRVTTTSSFSLQDRESDQLALSQVRPLAIVLKGDDRFDVTPNDVAILGSVAGLAVRFDCVEWLPDFVSDNDSSFLLTYCYDFMMFRSIWELNFLLKEDQRFSISSTVLENTWQSVLEWNSKIVGNAVDMSLD